MVLILFTMAFVLGPAVFLALARYDRPNWPLALIASACVVASFALRSEAGLSLTLQPVPVFLSLMLVWLAWILVMVLVVRALRATYSSPKAQRIARALCAMGTTVPWFGFATARMMGGA